MGRRLDARRPLTAPDGRGRSLIGQPPDVGPDGREFELRITIELLGPDAVRQTWEGSDDGASRKTGLSLDYEQR